MHFSKDKGCEKKEPTILHEITQPCMLSNVFCSGNIGKHRHDYTRGKTILEQLGSGRTFSKSLTDKSAGKFDL